MPASLPRPPAGPLIAPVSVKAVVRRGDSVLLGGRPEPGETHPAALVRELREETGLDVTVGRCVLDEVFEVVPTRLVRIVAFACALASADPPVASDEHDRVAFFSEAVLAGLALPDVYRRAIAAAAPPR